MSGRKKPGAIIAVTGGTCMSGIKPFPAIEDGNFHIPAASLDKEIFLEIEDKVLEKEMELSIVSQNDIATAYQLIASKKVANPKGTIVICAHMDSKSISGEPVCLWLPVKYRNPVLNEYVQGVEVEMEYQGTIPEGFEIIELPEAVYLLPAHSFIIPRPNN